jgi:hypothetical protein
MQTNDLGSRAVDDFRRSTRQLNDEQVIASLVRTLRDPREISRKYAAELISILKEELNNGFAI